MKSNSLRTAVLALMEYGTPAVSDPVVLTEYADSLLDMAQIANAAGRPATAQRYEHKAATLRQRALRASL